MTKTDDMADIGADDTSPTDGASALPADEAEDDDVIEEDEPGYKCTLSPESERRAKMELGETEDVRMLALMGIKNRMAQRPDIKFSQNDRFLLRFLRAKKYEIDRAFNSLVKYYELHLKHPDFFKDYKPSSIKHVLDDGFPMVLDHLDDEGRPVVVMKSGTVFLRLFIFGSSVHCLINSIVDLLPEPPLHFTHCSVGDQGLGNCILYIVMWGNP